VTNDPMEATYVGIHMWAQAVEKAKYHRRRQGACRPWPARPSPAPSGYTLTMDEKNHHLHKPVMIGEVQDDGQFNGGLGNRKPGPRSAVEPLHPRQRQEAGLRGEVELSEASIASPP
jgi:ABC-type branched-subunit amino acid transport system substrate-binding protein